MTVRAISEFTFAGEKYAPGDAFTHTLPDLELGGLVRTRLVEIVDEPRAEAAAQKKLRKRRG